MTAYDRDECYNRLAPEVKRFLNQLNKAATPPMSMQTYKARRRFIISMVRKEEAARFAGTIEDRVIPGPRGEIPVRLYMPEGGRPLPVLLYFHGGAWVVGNLDTEEDTCIPLARQTPCIVLSVDYRLAPEHPYPAGLEDCYAALEWVAQNAAAVGGDPGRIGVSGESAGGNLAIAVALMTKERGGPAISFQALFYPATDLSSYRRQSEQVFGEGFFISRADMEGSRTLYVPNEQDWTSPYVSPLLAPDLSGLPPAIIITSGCDPLRDGGEAYAKRLQDAGVPAKYLCFEDMIHAFLILFKSSDSRKKALEAASTALREAFERS
ncbi:MAG: Carboxylesterase NlhH [Syntrophorhabdaceae bacterium PtaU1.Bin034]|nr:MAG: Carboxylesterase NlhH [Syntrophorhabdaceae bacterium PtaU1.Bin034]